MGYGVFRQRFVAKLGCGGNRELFCIKGGRERQARIWGHAADAGRPGYSLFVVGYLGCQKSKGRREMIFVESVVVFRCIQRGIDNNPRKRRLTRAVLLILPCLPRYFLRTDRTGSCNDCRAVGGRQLIRSTTSEKIAYRKANRGDGPEFDDPMEGCGLLVARGALPLRSMIASTTTASIRKWLLGSGFDSRLSEADGSAGTDYGLRETEDRPVTLERETERQTERVCEEMGYCCTNVCETGNFFAVVTSPCQTVSKSPKNWWRTGNFFAVVTSPCQTDRDCRLVGTLLLFFFFFFFLALAGSWESGFLARANRIASSSTATQLNSSPPASNQGNPFDIAFDRKVGNWAVPWGSDVGAFRWRRCQSSPLRKPLSFVSSRPRPAWQGLLGKLFTAQNRCSVTVVALTFTAELLCLCDVFFFPPLPSRWPRETTLSEMGRLPWAALLRAGVSLKDDGALLSGALCPFRLGFFDFSIKWLDLLPDLVAGFGLWHPITLFLSSFDQNKQKEETVPSLVVDDSELARTKHQETFPVLSKLEAKSAHNAELTPSPFGTASPTHLRRKAQSWARPTRSGMQIHASSLHLGLEWLLSSLVIVERSHVRWHHDAGFLQVCV
ncbi:hypothetical protein CCUS01_06073 [Colletotrichum cuscutae]|uniref:Transmembrane protein n=1 Tax=Colletotrichum cuscutae TaxID=1209917 RepID=A0AAI9Y551_9PEZI|nr:hypothetical protein CCUS01_06073 [Colletotrichum cuscutae]